MVMDFEFLLHVTFSYRIYVYNGVYTCFTVFPPVKQEPGSKDSVSIPVKPVVGPAIQARQQQRMTTAQLFSSPEVS